MGYIYKITNKINNKSYIGQTRNDVKYRWEHHCWKANNPDKPDTDYPLYRSMRLYGIDNFIFTIIEEVNNELLNIRERYWIQTYNSYVPNGYNCNLGGEGSTKFDHNKIIQYFLNQGNKSASKTAKYFQCSLNTVLKILQVNHLEGQGTLQPIYQIDLVSGRIIKEFKSLVAAQKQLQLGRTQLWSAVNGQAKTAGGYAWCKVQDYKKFKLEEHIDKKKVQIYCHETNQIFDSVSSAVKWLKENNYSNNPSSSNIIKACNNQRKTAYKLHWSKI